MGCPATGAPDKAVYDPVKWSEYAARRHGQLKLECVRDEVGLADRLIYWPSGHRLCPSAVVSAGLRHSAASDRISSSSDLRRTVCPCATADLEFRNPTFGRIGL